MKKLMFGLLTSAVLTSLGCTDKHTVPEQPVAVTKSPETTRLAPPVSRVEASEIDETNVTDMVRRLDNDIKTDHRAMTKVGREGTGPK
jgi:hypothetical protein